MSTEVSTRPELSQHSRRNTFVLRPYVKNLGYSTADWEESLTVKFRDLPSHHDRMYTLFLGCSHRGDDHGSAVERAARPEPREVEMSRSQAVYFMGRLLEKLMHEGRTVRGIFEALGRGGKSEIDLRTYIEALEYMAVRTGTAIPTGAAEKALAFLCQHADHLWPFLQEELLGNDLGGDKKGGKYGSLENKGLGEKLLPLECIGSDMLGKSIAIDCTNKMYPLARVSAALEAFIIAFGDDGVAPGDFPLQDLTNFLYLGGQTKISLGGLKTLVDKYGRWALERYRRKLQSEKVKVAEAARR